MQLRIICIGNRFYHPDSGGPRVYDLLVASRLPSSTELIDGGLSGLNLLGLLEGVVHVIFVDTVEGFLPEGGVVIVENPELDLQYQDKHDHNSGLAYLLRSVPFALDSAPPGIFLVGMEGAVTPELCRKAAEKCLQLARKLARIPPVPI